MPVLIVSTTESANLEYLTTAQLHETQDTFKCLYRTLTEGSPKVPRHNALDYERQYKIWWDSQLANAEKAMQSRKVDGLSDLILYLREKRQELYKTERKREIAREKKRVEDHGGKEKRIVVTPMYMSVTMTGIDKHTAGRHSRLRLFPPHR